MKNKLTFLVMILLFLTGSSVLAQTASLPTITASPNEQLTIPLTVTGFSNIGSIMLSIQINTTVLTYTGFTGGPAGMLAGVNGTSLILTWAGPPYYTNSSGILANLNFRYNGPGTSPLTFIPEGCEIVQMPAMVPIPVTYTSGQVTPFLGNAAKATLMNNPCTLTGSMITVPIKYEGFQNNVKSIIQKVHYDATKLTFVSVTGTGTLAGVAASAAGGTVSITWGNASGTGINYPDNQFNLNFIYTGTAGSSLEFYPGCIITTNTSLNIPVSYFNNSITMSSLQVPTITPSGPTSFCMGGSVVLTSSPVPGNNYLWSNTATTQSITVSGGGIYAVTVTDGTCSATSSPTTVTVNQLPIPAISGQAIVIAGTTGISYSTQAGMTGYTWAVSTGGTITAGVGSNTILVTWNTVGAQWVSVNYTNGNGCTATSPATFQVTVNPPSNLIIQNLTIPTGQTNCYNATQTITVAGSSTTFIVQNGGSATFIAGQNILYLPGTVVESGGYMHGSIAPGGPWCGSLSPSMVGNVLAGTEDEQSPSLQADIKIYPNPTSGNFTVDFTGDHIIHSSSLEIYSMKGERILSKEMAGKCKHEFSLDGRPMGMYLIRVVSEGNVTTIRLIKQ